MVQFSQAVVTVFFPSTHVILGLAKSYMTDCCSGAAPTDGILYPMLHARFDYVPVGAYLYVQQDNEQLRMSSLIYFLRVAYSHAVSPRQVVLVPRATNTV